MLPSRFPLIAIASLMFLNIFVLAKASMADVSAPIICNKKQTRCTLYSNKLAMDDEVGILNNSSEFIAKGKVYRIVKGGWKIKITEKHNRIKNAYSFVILSKTDIDIRTDFDTYRPPALNQWGANIGTLSLGVGEGGAGIEAALFYQKLVKKFPVLFRVIFMSANGNISRGFGTPPKPITVNAFGALLGTSGLFWVSESIAMRFELAGGVMNASRSVADDDTNHPDYEITIDQGIGIIARGSIGAIIESGKLQYIAEISPAIVHATSGMSITIGFGKSID